MLPELNAIATVVAVAAVIGAGVLGLLAMPVAMTAGTVLTMVLPSMLVYGLIMLAIGIAHGQYRATR